jgi:hypothetical protein
VSVHEFIARIARFAVSKAAAFCYAVAVGVAGNLIFHFVQPATAPAVPAAVTAPRLTEPASHAATVAIPVKPAPPVASSASPVTGPAAPATTPLANHAALPAPAPRTTAPPRPTMPASLPEPPAPAALPRSDLLPTPSFKPTALPSDAATPAPAVSEAPPPPPPAPAALPPIGLAIDISSVPTPQPAVVEPPPARPATGPTPARAEPNGLELSDVWHPGRAVGKGLHWAGRQLPLVGGAEEPPPTPAPAPVKPTLAAPISLLPAEPANPAAPAAKSTAPGPGSGGLY